jgi:Xaa-Pro aminopeptidase
MKPWTKKQIEQHIEAGRRLGLVKDEFAQFLVQQNHRAKTAGTALTEYECLQFVKKLYKKHGLVNDTPKESCIVAFGKNTNQVHYFALKPLQGKGSGDRSTNDLAKTKSQKLEANSLALLDIWARLDQKNAPYADATFMFYFKGVERRMPNVANTIPKEIQQTWEALVNARDTALQFLAQKLKRCVFPRGLDIDRAAHDVIGNAGFGRGIKHTIGHSLGFDSPHGKLPGINWKEYSPLLKNVGYTIEPGIYLENFGMRSEIDFYIDDTEHIIITTPIQKEIEIL